VRHTKATQKANSRAYATVAGAVALMLGGMVLVGALTVAAVQESR